MSKRKQSLSEKLAELADPTPKFLDPEHEHDQDTLARVEDFEDEVQQPASTLKPGRNLRHHTALLSTDTRYAGKPVSRKSLAHDSETDDSGADSEDDATDEDLDELQAFRSKLSLHKKENSKYVDEDDDEESAEESSQSEEVEQESNDEEDLEEEEGSDVEGDEGLEETDTEASGPKAFSFGNFDSELQKGQAVRNQLGIWDQLLECRIKCQKLLVSSNKLPTAESYPLFSERGDKNYKTTVSAAKDSLRAMLDDLLELQTTLLAANPQTSYVVTGKPPQDGSDEEIPSDTEDEENSAQNDVKPPKKRQKLSEYAELLEKRHENFKRFRNQVLTFWNEKTRLGTGKSAKSFAAFEQPILSQIDSILADRHRIINRTRIQRSAYRILGKYTNEETSKEELVSHADKVKVEEDEEPEIFDDDDFYHQLLRELIERKTTDNSDPISMGRQWLEIQRMRAKAKRKVDTKASKGRKLRYDVHPKLVSFMAPYPATEWSDAARNDLFASVFGRSGDKKEV